MQTQPAAAIGQHRDSDRERHPSAGSGRAMLACQRTCDYLDGEIDKLIYALYGLTEEEVKIVEGSESLE
jgi:hypothetical protein